MTDAIEKVKIWLQENCDVENFDGEDDSEDELNFDNPEKPYYVYCYGDDFYNGGFATEDEAINDVLNKYYADEGRYDISIFDIENEIEIAPQIDISLKLKSKNPNYKIPNHLYESFLSNKSDYPLIRKDNNKLYILLKHGTIILNCLLYKISYYNKFVYIKNNKHTVDINDLEQLTNEEFIVFITNLKEDVAEQFENEKLWLDLNNLSYEEFINKRILYLLDKYKNLGGLNLSQLNNYIGFSSLSSISHSINKLIDNKKIQRIGEKAGTKYVLNQEG